MIKANIGITCMPKWALETFYLPETILFKRITSRGLKRKHYAVIRKQDEKKKYMTDLIKNFQEELQNSIFEKKTLRI